MANCPGEGGSLPSGPEILIVAGEASGDHYGAELVHRIAEANPSVRFFGMGGDRMAARGVDLLHHIREVSVMGFVEVLSRIGPLYRSFRTLIREAERRRPAAAVYIDFPDYNLRLAPRIKARSGARNIYYIGPTVWAWRKGRVETIRATIDRMLVIFPFEEPIYRQAGVNVQFVGHPLAGQVKSALSPEEFRKQFAIPQGPPLIGLLPGSRAKEIDHILPVLAGALGPIAAGLPEAPVFALGLAESVDRAQVEAVLGRFPHRVTIVEHATWELMQHADVLLVACGTAPLEASLLGTPQVVVYRTSPLTYGIALGMVDVPHVCIVNLILGERLLPELIQRDFTPERVADEALRLLRDPAARARQIEGFAHLRARIGTAGAARRAAKAILSEARLTDWSPSGEAS